MIRDIVANLPVRSNSGEIGHFAISVARRLGAHVTGTAFVYEPFVPPAPALSLPPNFIEQQQEQAIKSAKEAIEQFERAAKREELSREVHRLAIPTMDAPRDFAEIARRFDLAIVPQANPNEVSIDGLIAEVTLFESGRPILLMPYTQRGSIKLDLVTICWDGSRAAARALADALPFLKQAKTVDIFIAEGEPAKSKELAGADVAQHLARHDINVTVERTMMTIDIASTILNFVSDRGTDLLVMGGYGHSRLREFILGGATRGILQSMTVPVLMSH